MNLVETKARFKAGALTKALYIDRMHQRHCDLFEYADFIGGTDIAFIEISDNRVVMTSRSRGVKVVCDRSDKRLAPMEILNFDHYEKSDSDMLMRLIRPGNSVFDIGANIGWYSLNIARAYPDARIHAFEPLPRTYGLLTRNLEVNGLPGIRAFNFGLSDRAGSFEFQYDQTSSGGASLAGGAASASTVPVLCALRTLDDVVAELAVPVDFIKCDVEGAELLVLRGGLQTLKQHKPILFLEMLRKWCARFNYHPNDIIALLKSLGYRCFAAHGDQLAAFELMDETTAETNFFFLHTARHAVEIAALERK